MQKIFEYSLSVVKEEGKLVLMSNIWGEKINCLKNCDKMYNVLKNILHIVAKDTSNISAI